MRMCFWNIMMHEYWNLNYHYSDVIMSTMASQTTGVPTVCSTICSCAEQRKHQSSASLALWGESIGDRCIPLTKDYVSFMLCTNNTVSSDINKVMGNEILRDLNLEEFQVDFPPLLYRNLSAINLKYHWDFIGARYIKCSIWLFFFYLMVNPI